MEILLALAVIGLLLLLVGIILLWLRLGELDHRLKRLEARPLDVAVDPGKAFSAVEGAVPTATPTAPAPVAPPSGVGDLFERLIGGRLLIWVGGIALVAAAIFLIRFSIENGLITPQMRMVAAGLFGALLVAGGEWARVSPAMADDRRVSQALVGAGLATLYATVYGSYWLYGFFSLTVASLLMLAVTALALGLSFRHGPPTAVMGLIGGFLTPLLVGDPSAGATPLLAYLALLDAAVFAIALRRGWDWLAGLAILFSLAWTGVLLFDSPTDAMAAGWFALVLAILAGLAGKKDGHIGSGWPMAIAAVEVTLLAMRNDVGQIGLGQFALAGGAALVLARLRPATRWVPLVAILAGLLILPVKMLMSDRAPMAEITLIMTLIHGGGALLLTLERRRGILIGAACFGIAWPILLLRLIAPEVMSTAMSWGLVIGALGLLPLVLVRRGGRLDESLGAAGTSTFMLAVALSDIVAWDALSIAWLALSIALIAVGVQAGFRALRITGLALLTATVLKAFLIDAAALDGVWRILSFVGLGAALIVIGRYFGRLVRAEAVPAEA